MRTYYPQIWGALFDGINDDTLAVQAAYDCAANNGGGIVNLSGGKIKTTASLITYPYTSTIMSPDTEIIFSPLESSACFLMGGDFYDVYAMPFVNFQMFEGVRINISNAPTGSVAFDFSEFNFNSCKIQASVLGNAGLDHKAFYSSDNNMLNRHNNLFEMTIRNCKHPDGAFHVKGNLGDNKQFNYNILRLKVNGYKLAFNICGQANILEILTGSPDSPLLLNNAGGYNFRGQIKDGLENIIRNSYHDAGYDEVLYRLIQPTYNTLYPVVHFESLTINHRYGQSQVIYVSDDRMYPATYIDNNTFSVVGNLTANFSAGKLLWADSGPNDGRKKGKVQSCSYSNPNTIVILSESDCITTNLTEVWIQSDSSVQPTYAYSGPENILTLNPISVEPQRANIGMIALADCINWDPCNKGEGGPYLCWYNGGQWRTLDWQ